MKAYIHARKFAEALLDVSSNTAQTAEELTMLAPLWSELNDVIPMYLSDAEKTSRLQTFEVSSTVQMLLRELSRSGKMRLLPEIASQFMKLQYAKNDTAVARVTAKRDLRENEQESLQKVLKDRHQKNIVIETLVDETVIDGLKVEMDYHVIDDTVATKLNLLVQKLSQEMEVV